jgi:hypothetical protein
MKPIAIAGALVLVSLTTATLGPGIAVGRAGEGNANLTSQIGKQLAEIS